MHTKVSVFVLTGLWVWDHIFKQALKQETPTLWKRRQEKDCKQK